jgi:hypothetical protein
MLKKFPEFDMITKWNRLLFEKRSAFYRKTGRKAW